MRIAYNQRQNRNLAVYGVILMTLSIISVAVYDSQIHFATWLGILYLGLSFYRFFVPYATAENGYLRKGLGAKMPLSEVIEVRRFVGDYIFKSGDKTITIDRNAIDKKSSAELERLFEDLRDGKYKVEKIVHPA